MHIVRGFSSNVLNEQLGYRVFTMHSSDLHFPPFLD